MSLFPGRQFMISRSEPTLNVGHYPATDSDVAIRNVETIPEWDLAYRDGFRFRYTMEWTTYVGWKVYMLATGILAWDSRFEEKES